MRRLAVLVMGLSLFAAPALAQTLSVRTDQAVRIALPSPAKDVAIGNPAIADVVVMDERNILVVGKSAGTTTVIVLDRGGRMIVDRTVIVAGNDVGQVSVFKGGAASQYTCSPRCEMTDGEEPRRR
ncbi:pilus assembly protein CpaC [Caulobacter sp. SLTY]|uniref:pilus assembly protein N-terminal domain-containing protein n=1 Tax=Caulobacter sp. SLTY TaxID=2683262 RepID=UPI001413066E|nr:pilus assembly protein N-terminal domain-containing protein [Caulobacter sp. SLTY]NBB16558.1 pilus assembly protein CpaC [Caulobacter sp. SLTY]